MASAATWGIEQAELTVEKQMELTAKNILESARAGKIAFEASAAALDATMDYMDTYDGYYATAVEAANAVLEAARACKGAYAEMMTAEAALETVIAEAERVIDTRTLARQQATDALTKTRYNEMFFRLARNNALSRYSSQFELAQKYAYLAAQAYDYETGLLSTDRQSGERFLARIVAVPAARAQS